MFINVLFGSFICNKYSLLLEIYIYLLRIKGIVMVI